MTITTESLIRMRSKVDKSLYEPTIYGTDLRAPQSAVDDWNAKLSGQKQSKARIRIKITQRKEYKNPYAE